jgi:hypothetical protein
MTQLVRSEIILDNTVIEQKYSIVTNGYVIVFDTETFTDIEQKARIAMYTMFDLKEASNNPTEIKYIAKGMVVYDLLPNELAILKEYCKENDLKLISKETFINKLLFPSLKAGSLLVGHNVTFDIGAICTDFMVVPDSKQFRLKICYCGENNNIIHTHDRITIPCEIHPSIIIEQVKTRKYLIYLEKDDYGTVIDTITLGNALLGAGKSGLDIMIKRYGHTDKGKKTVESYSTEYDKQFYEYAMHDVYLTSILIASEYKLYLQHGINKPFHTIMSEASVGKAYNEKLGVPPFKYSHVEVPNSMYNDANEAYFGARSEVHIRMKPTEILYCDFKSQYPLVNALLDSQTYLLAKYLRLEHCVEEAQELVNNIVVDDLNKKEMWKKLSILVKVKTNNAILPFRDRVNSSTTIYGQTVIKSKKDRIVGWYSLIDVVASKIRTGIALIILDAYKLVPQDSIETNQINVLGNAEYHVNLKNDDFFVKVIDLRDSVKTELKQVKKDINNKPTEELYHRKNFLDNLQLALKLMANSTAYGILVETREVERKDIAAKYNALPIGTHITAGARLLLAIAEKLGLDRGIEHAFCDTDSFAYARPENMSREDFYTNVQDCIKWFNNLSPYASNDSIFELEEYNYGVEGYNYLEEKVYPNKIVPLYALCVSTKRYVIYNKLKGDKFLIRKMTEHGIPYYLLNNNMDLPSDVIDIERDETSMRKFKIDRYMLWYRAIEQIEKNIYPIVPNENWSEQYAIEQEVVSTPRVYNYLSYIPNIRPFSFFIVTSQSKFKNRKFRYYMPFINNSSMVNQMLKEGKIRKVFTNEVVTEIEIDSVKERLDDFFTHVEKKSSNGDSIGTMNRRVVDSMIKEKRLRSGKKVTDIDQLEMEW